MKIVIANKTISERSSPFVIAEAGVNHNGRLDLALRMVDVAAAAGADAIKFQTFRAQDLAAKSAKMAAYQKRNTGKSESQLAMLKRLELKESFYEPIVKRCKKRKIIFLSTPLGGFEPVDFLEGLGVSAFKVASCDLDNIPVLGYIARLQKPIILSTGMANMREINEAITCIKSQGNNKIIALHCTANYPCPLEEVNLASIQTMMQKLGVLVGYSDHTLGIHVSVMAAALGACVIEKHFTLDAGMRGPDHKASISPAELKELVTAVKSVRTVLGSPDKKPTKSERAMIKDARKSVVAVRDIKKGELFTKENIGIKRPGTGLSPKHYSMIIGTRARKNIAPDTLLKQEHYA